jgi:hypothetical protein
MDHTFVDRTHPVLWIWKCHVHFNVHSPANFGIDLSLLQTSVSMPVNKLFNARCLLFRGQNDHNMSTSTNLSVSSHQTTLRETATLPSVKNTRQSSKNTRQMLCRVLHSVEDTRKRKCRQRGLCQVHFVGHSAKPLPSAKSRTRQNLSAVTEQAPNGRFAECRVLDTRQRNHLCRAPSTSHSAKKLSLPSAKKLALGKEISLPSVFSRQSAQNYPF